MSLINVVIYKYRLTNDLISRFVLMTLLNRKKKPIKGCKYGNSLSKCGNIMAIATISSINGVYSILFAPDFHRNSRLINESNGYTDN
tara:strand:+ start:523 stop:783 length:261 start_codon:yes stop_codon:yes gene_type:complete